MQITFFEVMAKRDYLEEQPNFCAPIPGLPCCVVCFKSVGGSLVVSRIWLSIAGGIDAQLSFALWGKRCVWRCHQDGAVLALLQGSRKSLPSRATSLTPTAY